MKSFCRLLIHEIHACFAPTQFLDMKKIQNLIIGAGPDGLAIAGSLSKLNIPFEVIEKTNHVSSTWGNRYDRLHLHTSKDLSNLTHLKFP